MVTFRSFFTKPEVPDEPIPVELLGEHPTVARPEKAPRPADQARDRLDGSFQETGQEDDKVRRIARDARGIC